MNLKITVNYPVNVVKDIMRFAEDFVFGNAAFKLPDDFKVWVKNSRHAYAGMFYGDKISIRIGKPNQYPRQCKYPNRVTAPEYMMNDWQEGLVAVAIHELWHYYQMKTNSGYSENETEQRTVTGLELFRTKRTEFDARWKAHTDKQDQRKAKAALKETPEYELDIIAKKIAVFQRRMKLYTTKLKKLQRRQRHLQKKISMASSSSSG